jgi:hypothetical protein
VNPQVNNQDKKPAQVAGIKPADVKPPEVNPAAVIPPVQRTGTSEIEQQAIALYNQKRYSEASPLLEKVCTLGSWEACKDLGNLYHDGNGVAKDGSRAATL